MRNRPVPRVLTSKNGFWRTIISVTSDRADARYHFGLYRRWNIIRVKSRTWRVCVCYNQTCSMCVSVAPIVSLRLGNSINPNGIKEGDDVYFDCHVKANPPSTKLTWYHNVSTFRHYLYNTRVTRDTIYTSRCYYVLRRTLSKSLI